jgi:hypothetical protein
MTLYAGLDISMRSVALGIVDQDGRRKRRNGWEAEGDSRARGRRFELLLASGSVVQSDQGPALSKAAVISRSTTSDTAGAP